jgi:hypothetical protein
MPNDDPNGERFPRGSKPPLLKLSEALALTQEVFDNVGLVISFDAFSRLSGNSPSSSSFVRKVNSLKTYGLLSEFEKGALAVSELGLMIVAPKSPEDAALAKKQLFLKIDVFNRIYERHKGKLLPADEFLKNIVEQECAKPRELSQDWVLSFKDAAKAIGILFDRGDGKIQLMESPIIRYPRGTPEPVPASEQAIVVPVKQPEQDNHFSPLASSGHLTKIEISGGRYAAFTVPDRLTKRDAQKLKGALTGLSQIIDSMVDDGDSN